MAFQLLIKDAGCFRQANVWYVEGELLSGDLSKDTPAIALTGERELPVFIRNVSFVDPPAPDRRFFTLTIDKPDYEIGWLKGATLIADEEKVESEPESSIELKPAGVRQDFVAGS